MYDTLQKKSFEKSQNTVRKQEQKNMQVSRWQPPAARPEILPCVPPGKEIHLKQRTQRKQAYTPVIQREGDPIVNTLLVPHEIELAKIGVNQVMPKLIAAIRRWAETNSSINTILSSPGRDAVVYAERGESLVKCINRWADTWSIEQTVGLLLDLGLNLRKQTAEADFINPLMATGRSANPDPHEKKCEIAGSLWASYLPEDTEVQAGVSATTSCLLRTLKHLSTNVYISLFEIESIVLGAILYWDGKREGSNLKMTKERRDLGLFHTASEVWSVYTQYYLTEVLKRPHGETFDS